MARDTYTHTHTVADTRTHTRTAERSTYLICRQMISFKMQMRIEHDLVLSEWISLFR